MAISQVRHCTAQLCLFCTISNNSNFCFLAVCVYFLYILIWTSDLRNRLQLSKMGWVYGIVYELCFNGLGPIVCCLLRFDSTWHIQRGMIFFSKFRLPIYVFSKFRFDLLTIKNPSQTCTRNQRLIIKNIHLVFIETS